MSSNRDPRYHKYHLWRLSLPNGIKPGEETKKIIRASFLDCSEEGQAIIASFFAEVEKVSPSVYMVKEREAIGQALSDEWEPYQRALARYRKEEKTQQ